MKKKGMILFIHLELIVASIIVLVPVFWIIMSSFQQESSLVSATLIPKSFTLENYRRLFVETNYINWFWNTLKIAAVNAVFSVFIVMITAWIMSRFQFRGRKTGLITILLLSMFPTFLSMTAVYTLFLTLGMVGNPVSLIIVYIAGAIPYNTWLVKGYLDGIPKSIDEAAYLDGCGRFQAFFKVLLPVSKPIITYCAVSQFMLPWMDYILPNMLLSSSDKNKTLAVGLFSMIDGKENSFFTTFAAGAVLIAIPITLLFIFFQKYLVQGVAAGADKG